MPTPRDSVRDNKEKRPGNIFGQTLDSGNYVGPRYRESQEISRLKLIEISKLNEGVLRLMLENSIIMFFGITDEGTVTPKIMLNWRSLICS